MIDTTKKYFVPMKPVHSFFGFCSFTSSADTEHLTLCHLEPYDFDGYNYKLYAKAEEDGYGSQRFYMCDFESIVEQGIIIPMDDESMRVEVVHKIEPITELAYLIHEGEIIVKG
ncbi:MAG: hypothetical protein EOM50_18530 [Erysipelotrichia bacterium]|nr:hypothetical protein [Erysipelotrichia bacterium]